MPRVFIIRLILVLQGNVLCLGQQELNDSLLFYEYAYYKSEDAAVKQTILLSKINFYIRNGFTNANVFHEIKRVDLNKLIPIQTDFLWNAAMISYLNNENDRAGFFLQEYNLFVKDTSMAAGLLKILIYKYSDTSLTHETINQLATRDKLFSELNCFKSLAVYQKNTLIFT